MNRVALSMMWIIAISTTRSFLNLWNDLTQRLLLRGRNLKFIKKSLRQTVRSCHNTHFSKYPYFILGYTKRGWTNVFCKVFCHVLHGKWSQRCVYREKRQISYCYYLYRRCSKYDILCYYVMILWYIICHIDNSVEWAGLKR